MRRRAVPVAALLLLVVLGACETPVPERQPEEPERPAAPSPEPPAPTPAPGFHAIVEATEGHLFGAAEDGRWLGPDSAAPRVREDDEYRIYTLSRALGERRGGAPLPPAETCSNPVVPIGDVPAGEDVIAVAGAWDALPRPPSVQSADQPLYRDALADWLRVRGIGEPELAITQILRVDLDGEGVDDVLIAANLIRGAGTSALPGDYSVVLLRRVVDGDLRTIALAQEYYPDGCIGDCAPAEHRVAAVLDLNGDGRLEIVLGWRDYEGRGQIVRRIDGIDSEEVLSWMCVP